MKNNKRWLVLCFIGGTCGVSSLLCSDAMHPVAVLEAAPSTGSSGSRALGPHGIVLAGTGSTVPSTFDPRGVVLGGTEADDAEFEELARSDDFDRVFTEPKRNQALISLLGRNKPVTSKDHDGSVIEHGSFRDVIARLAGQVLGDDLLVLAQRIITVDERVSDTHVARARELVNTLRQAVESSSVDDALKVVVSNLLKEEGYLSQLMKRLRGAEDWLGKVPPICCSSCRGPVSRRVILKNRRGASRRSAQAISEMAAEDAYLRFTKEQCCLRGSCPRVTCSCGSFSVPKCVQYGRAALRMVKMTEAFLDDDTRKKVVKSRKFLERLFETVSPDREIELMEEKERKGREDAAAQKLRQRGVVCRRAVEQFDNFTRSMEAALVGVDDDRLSREAAFRRQLERAHRAARSMATDQQLTLTDKAEIRTRARALAIDASKNLEDKDDLQRVTSLERLAVKADLIFDNDQARESLQALLAAQSKRPTGPGFARGEQRDALNAWVLECNRVRQKYRTDHGFSAEKILTSAEEKALNAAIDADEGVQRAALVYRLVSPFEKKKFDARLSEVVSEELAQRAERKARRAQLARADDGIEEESMGSALAYTVAGLLKDGRLDLAYLMIEKHVFDPSIRSRVFRVALDLIPGSVCCAKVFSRRKIDGRGFLKQLLSSMDTSVRRQLPHLPKDQALLAQRQLSSQHGRMFETFLNTHYRGKFGYFGKDKHPYVALLKLLTEAGLTPFYRDNKGRNAIGILKDKYADEIAKAGGALPSAIVAVKKFLDEGLNIQQLERALDNLDACLACCGSSQTKALVDKASEGIKDAVGAAQFSVGPLAFPLATIASQLPGLVHGATVELLKRVKKSKGKKFDEAAHDLTTLVALYRGWFRGVEQFDERFLHRLAYLGDRLPVKTHRRVVRTALASIRQSRRRHDQRTFKMGLAHEFAMAISGHFGIDRLKFFTPEIYLDTGDWPEMLRRFDAEHNPAVFWYTSGPFIMQHDAVADPNHRLHFVCGIAKWLANCTGKIAVYLPITTFFTYFRWRSEKDDEKAHHWKNLARLVGQGQIILCVDGCERVQEGAFLFDRMIDSDAPAVTEGEVAQVRAFFSQNPVVQFSQAAAGSRTGRAVNAAFSSVEAAIKDEGVQHAAAWILRDMEENCRELTREERVLRYGDAPDGSDDEEESDDED